MDGLHSSSYFQVLQSLYQTFGDCIECTLLLLLLLLLYRSKEEIHSEIELIIYYLFFNDEDEIRTHAGRSQWISNQSP